MKPSTTRHTPCDWREESGVRSKAMKRAPLLLFAGTAAGFIGVLGFHSRQAPPIAAAPQAGSGASAASPSAPGRTPTGPAVRQGNVRSALGPQEQYGYGVLDVRV